MNSLKKMYNEYFSWCHGTALPDDSLLKYGDENVTESQYKQMTERIKRMTNVNWFFVHTNVLEKFFTENVELKDNKPKNKNLTSYQKKEAISYWEQNDKVCPVCKIKTEDSNKVIDHFLPKSEYGDTQYAVVMCKDCNQKKSNNDPASLQALLIFNEKFPSMMDEYRKNN